MKYLETLTSRDQQLAAAAVADFQVAVDPVLGATSQVQVHNVLPGGRGAGYPQGCGAIHIAEADVI